MLIVPDDKSVITGMYVYIMSLHSESKLQKKY